MADLEGREPVFLFSDIESSTQLWEHFPEAMQDALAQHDALLTDVIRDHGGHIIKHTGDGLFALFQNDQSLCCAIKIQQQIAQAEWGAIDQLRVRLALHSGHAERRGEDYFGLVIHRTARLLSAGWGGQILATPEAIDRSKLPINASLLNLGVHLLKDLGKPHQIFQVQHPQLVLNEFPPLKTLAVRPHNLPPQPTPFIGREQELAEITAHLRDTPCRLLTLVGPGGIGKTRLALQAAAELIESFAQGVYFVALAPVSSPEFLLSTIADALSFNFYSPDEPKRQMIDYLREKQMLLVLDNFEHLMDGSSLVTEMLKSAPNLKLLVTSRERLQIQGEWVFRIHGLDFPENDMQTDSEAYSAIRLFVQSAERVRPQFTLAAEDRRAVARICELVEGTPLGIELAASWVEVLPVNDIACEIEKNRDFLSTTLRDVPERHRSLRAVFEYSWKLLTPDEQEIFKKLSVFRGTFRREAAQQVADADLAQLSTLVNKSLLRVQSPGRYEMLEVLRGYAAEKLEQNPTQQLLAHERHSLFFSDFLENRESDLTHERQREALEEVRQEIENIRGGWRWATANQKPDLIKKAIQGLHLYYEMRSWFQEGEEVFRQALTVWSTGTQSGQDIERTARKFAVRQASFCHRLGQSTKARALLESALSSDPYDGDLPELALILNTLGNVEYALGEITQARKMHQESLRIREEMGGLWAIATSLSNLGVVADRLGHVGEAQELFQKSLEHRRQIGDRFGMASSLNNLGVLAARLGEYAKARELHQESLAIRRELGDRKGITESLNNLGVVADALGLYEESKHFYAESLALSKEIGDQLSVARSLSNLGFVAYNLGEYEEAVSFCQQSLRLNRQLKNHLGIIHALNGLGNAECELEKIEDAEGHFREALKVAKDYGQPAEQLDVLLGIALLFTQRGVTTSATQILNLVGGHPEADPISQKTAQQLLSEISPKDQERQSSKAAASLDQVIDSILDL